MTSAFLLRSEALEYNSEGMCFALLQPGNILWSGLEKKHMQKDCRYCSPEHIGEVWCQHIRDQNSRTLVPQSTEISGRIPNIKQHYQQPQQLLSVAASFFSRLLLLRGSNPYMVQFMVHSLNVLLSTGAPRPDPSTKSPHTVRQKPSEHNYGRTVCCS